MKESELKLRPCHCGGEIKIEKVAQNGGMDGTYWNWELTCSKCGLTKSYAADGFYGREYKTLEEVVDDWNKKREESKTRKGQMNKKLADVTVKKSADYYNKVVKALEDAGFVIVLDCETTTDMYYIVAESEDKE